MNKRNLTLLAGLAVGGIFLWLALRDVDFQAVGEAMAAADLWLAAPFIACLGLFYLLKARRWSLLLSPIADVEARRLLPPMMIGFAGNNVLPVRLGEVIRIFLCSREHGIPSSSVLATVALERLFDAVALLLIAAVSLAVVPVVSPQIVVARYVLGAAVVGAILLVYGFVAAPPWLARAARLLVGPVPRRWRERLEEQARGIRSGFGSIRSSSMVLRMFVNSLLQWVLLAACVYLSMLAFQLAITPVAAVVVLVLIVIGISLPNAPAFVGTIEYCFVGGLGLFGVEAATALGIALFYHALAFLFVTLSGMYFIRRYGTSWRALRHADRNVPSPPL